MYHAATLRRNSLSFNVASTFYKAGNAVAQSAGTSLEKMAMGRVNASPHRSRPSPGGRFDLVRPPVNSAGRDPSSSPNRGPSKVMVQKRILIGFGGAQQQPAETRRDTIGHAFPSREKLKNGHDRKVNGKADFYVSPSIKQRAQRRNTIAHQTLAAQATTKSTRTLNLSALREDMEILSARSGDEGVASLKPSSSAPDCAEFANQSIRRNSQDYRSHVEYYRPKLQLNRCSAIKQGCSTQEDIHQMTTKLQQAAHNKRLSSCSTGSGPASPNPRRSTPPPSSTLNHIMMMNQSGLEEIADLYKRIESGATIDRAILTDDSSSSSIEANTAEFVPKLNEPIAPAMSVFEKMYRRSSLQ